MQKPFEHPVEWKRYYSISNTETEEMNTYLSYNKVVGTSLDEKLYLAFSILDYALLSAPGAPLKKALTDAGIGHDILALTKMEYASLFSPSLPKMRRSPKKMPLFR